MTKGRNKLIDTFQSISPAFRFFILLISIYLSIYFLHQWYILPDGRIDNWLTYVLSVTSEQVLKLISPEAYLKIIPQEPLSQHYLYLGNRAVVFIGAPCNGFLLYVLYACFILLSTGNWQQKLIFTVLGIGLIFVLNIIRVIALLYILIIDRNLFDLNHHFVFNFIVYGIIFLLWHYWFNRQADRATT
ncbi:exosortase X [Thermoflexibacter ruber]|uniref:Exosortase family protein XrtF n=1 Tax=Thermoflexibacter ruber TaxID=1003 RepID=A0A1I2GAV6_9BACT|nr:archaeosortase/exosortase family protein [Thermoflexibacter ruber]SFF14067.1 exosortase family protein XrtF [Thermoflexibacter ruber]